MDAFDNTVTITTPTGSKSGWTAVTINRGIEAVPSVAQIEVTEEYPNRSDVLPFAPGQSCVITIGPDPIITGYIDRYTASYAAASHTVTITVRSKLEDSVDASAELGNGGSQVIGMNLANLSKELVTGPYGIQVVNKAHADDPVPAFNLNLGETSFDIITRVAHTMATLVYDDTDGNLVLAKVGQEGTHSSGFREGEGIQTCTVNFSMDQRFSEYITVFDSVSLTQNLGNNIIEGNAFDYDVPRNRKKYIISPVPANNGLSSEEWGNNVAQWMKNRNWGRGHAVEITCDSWRDSDGRLWTPNAFAPANSPTVHLIDVNWIIASVKFSLTNESGTTADVVLMPQEAFTIEPTALYRLPPNLSTDTADESAGTSVT